MSHETFGQIKYFYVLLKFNIIQPNRGTKRFGVEEHVKFLNFHKRFVHQTYKGQKK